ncbi:MAG: phosphatase PAP2 family protein [Ferruginibacter sp.]
MIRRKCPFPAKQLVIPALLIGYGVTAIENNGLKNLNDEVKEELVLENPHRGIHIDNYLQFTPAVAVYSLNMAGIKGAHNLVDRSAIYLLSNIIVNSSVSGIKKYSHQARPDGSGYSSFPSGHTAEAFASAEFLRQEYKNVSVWYGIAGYAVAATTGYLRMYNNKHWMSDVIAGAGVGIASTKIAYWLYPKIKHVLFKEKLRNTCIIPTYQNKFAGFVLIHNFSK